MSTSDPDANAAHQRAYIQRIKDQGFVMVKVKVPRDDIDVIRTVAYRLCIGWHDDCPDPATTSHAEMRAYIQGTLAMTTLNHLDKIFELERKLEAALSPHTP